MIKIENIGLYDPTCKLYPKEQRGKVKYYVTYYLPNGKRMQRPVHSDYAKAEKMVNEKKIQLIQGYFDVKDQKKARWFLFKYAE